MGVLRAAALGLLLLEALRAFPQGQDPKDACAGVPGQYYDKAAGRCCYRCPPGQPGQQLCPQGPLGCRKRCRRDYYVAPDGRCTACVSCGDDLVEKKPCSWNSSRVCECQPGMYCVISATNSCARCRPHSVCPTGMIVKLRGTAERDTVCELPSPGASPDCRTRPGDCQAPARGTPLQATPVLTAASWDVRTRGDPPFTPDTPASPPAVGKPSPHPGLCPPQLCPQGSPSCRKQCRRDYYLDRECRCTACVSCSGDDLVEKTPCTWNSSRICECRPGMFCVTSATNSCARCSPHSVCPPGMIVKFQGTAERDTVCELPSPGASPDCRTRPGDCQAPARGTPLQATPVLTSASWDVRTRGDPPFTPDTPASPPAVGKPSPHPGSAEKVNTYEPRPLKTHRNYSTNPEDSQAPSSASLSLAEPQTSMGRGGGTTHAGEDTFIPTSTPVSFSSMGRPILVSGPVLLWLLMALLLLIGSGSFVLCHRRACWKWLRQKLHLCHSVRTFRLKPGPVVSLEGTSCDCPHFTDEHPEAQEDSRSCKNPTPKRSVSEVEPCTEKLRLMSPPAVETCTNVGASCPESLRLLDGSPAGSPSAPRDLPEPRVTTEHTNNRIEKIYIMKADTVIVGTVKTEVPEGRALAGPAAPDLGDHLEVDHAPHYPEQETEPPLGSCGHVMFSVEEEGKEGKEDALPTTASGK